MSTLSAIYSGYRERPRESIIRSRGDEYLWSEYPRLSHIISAQQVAFVEEPFAMSKNMTGLLITLVMVSLAGCCCLGLRALQRRGSKNLIDGPEEDDVDFRPHEGGEEGEEEEEEEDGRYLEPDPMEPEDTSLTMETAFDK